MTISFSGLASGLDTSSWIKSLTALKQAKVTTLQEQREELVVSKNTLSSIRSFFTSFRSTLEKITDSRFNIVSMNLFAQNLANSANTSIVTATATSEAEEGKYEVKVDKLASNTQAVSKNNYTKTETKRETVKGNTQLKDIGEDGIRSGNIQINGEEFFIDSNWTMDEFISELKAEGYKAEFNERTGKFSANFNANNIIDTDYTGIIEALHLSSVNKGYTSNNLTTEKVETENKVADLDTSIWAIEGINAAVRNVVDEKEDHTDGDARTLTIEAGGESFYVMLDSDETIQSLMDAINEDGDLDAKGVKASFNNGVFKLTNAKVVEDGDTNFINAFGIRVDVAHSSQQSAVIIGGNIESTVTADENTFLTALQGGTGITNTDTVIVEDDVKGTTTITLEEDWTIGSLLSAMSSAGFETATIDANGVVTLDGARITGGDVDVKALLGLTETVTGGETSSTEIIGSNQLLVTIPSTETTITNTTTLGSVGIENTDTLQIFDANGNEIYSSDNLSDLNFDELFSLISEKVQEDGGNITTNLTNGVITLKSSSSHRLAGEVAEKLGLTNVVSGETTTTTTGASQSSSVLVTYTTSTTASTDSTLQEIGVSQYELDVYNADGTKNEILSTTFGADTSISSILAHLTTAGIEATLENGIIKITDSSEGRHIKGGLAEALGIGASQYNGETVTTGTTLTSASPVTYQKEETATGNSTLAQIFSDMTAEEIRELTIIDNSSENNSTDDYTLQGLAQDLYLKNAEDLTLNELLTIFENELDYTTTLGADGRITLTTNIDGFYITGTLAEAMGIGASSVVTTTTLAVDQTSTAPVTYTKSVLVTGSTQISDIYEGSSFLVTVKASGTNAIHYKTDGLTALSSVTASDMVSGSTFKIATTDDLLQLATIVNSRTNCSGVTFVMANDIDLSSIENWTPIGNSGGSYFSGIFDGNGFEISGLTIDASSNYQGLFGYIQNATIKNLGIVGYDITNTGERTGALAGYASHSTIQNVYTSGEMVNAGRYSGGLIGFASSTEFTSCRVSGTISSSSSRVGGLTGYAKSVTINNTCATNLELQGSDSVGGLVGLLEGVSSITSVYSSGTITATDSTKANTAGGLIATVSGGTIIQNAYFKGYVSSGGGAIAGSVSSTSTLTLQNTQALTTNYVADGTYTDGGGNGTISEDDVPFTVNAKRDSVVLDLSGLSLEQMFSALDSVGVTGTITDGVISFTSDDGTYVTGDILTSWGITTQVTESGETIFNSHTSSAPITYTTSENASLTTLVQKTYETSDNNIYIKDSSNNYIGTVSVTETMTFDDLFAELESFGIEGSIDSNGVVSFNSDTYNYLQGRLINDWCISRTSTVVTVTTAVDQTSSIQVTYSSSAPVTGSTEISDFYTGSSIITVKTADGSWLHMDTTGLTALSSVTASDMVSGSTFKIATTDDLLQLATIVNSGTNCSGVTFVMANDIDLSSIENWTPIATDLGNLTTFFSGIFDGNGYEITGLNIYASQAYQGLFGHIENATIKNLGIVGYDITSTSSASYTGVLAGKAHSSTIHNVYTSGEMNSSSDQSGGLIGAIYNVEITSCQASGTILSTSSNVGGLVGITRGSNSITRSCTTDMIIQGTNNVGGLVGYNFTGDNNCTYVYASNTTVTATNTENANSAGGLIGTVRGGTNIQTAYFKGYVSSGGGEIAGSVSSTSTLTLQRTQALTTNYVADGTYNGRGCSTITMDTTPFTVNAVRNSVNIDITGMTVDEMYSALGRYGVTGSIDANGVMSFSGNIVSGAPVAAWGVSTSSTITSTTLAVDQTSTEVVMYTTTIAMTGANKISDYMEVPSAPPSTGTYTITGTINFDGSISGGSVVAISTSNHLKYIRAGANAGNTYEGITFVITNDITAYAENQFTAWKTIGSSTVAFAGTIDGQGHTIKLASGHAAIGYNADPNAGLFHTLSGTVKNLNVAGTINVADKTESTGAIACTMTGGTISNCKSSVDFINFTNTTIPGAGGLVGTAKGQNILIENSVVESNFDGEISVGGLIGGIYEDSNVTMQNVLFKGSITNNSYMDLQAGLVGGTSGTLSITNAVVDTDSNIGIAFAINQSGTITASNCITLNDSEYEFSSIVDSEIDTSSCYYRPNLSDEDLQILGFGDQWAVDSSGEIQITTTEAPESAPDNVLTIKNNSGAIESTFTISEDTTFDNLLTWLNNNNITATMTDGVISMSGADGLILEGIVAEELGIASDVTTQTSHRAIYLNVGADNITETNTVKTGSTICADMKTISQVNASIDISTGSIVGGNATDGTIVAITTAAELTALGKKGLTYTGVHFILADDIDLGNVITWKGIKLGQDSVFDGHGHTIAAKTSVAGNGFFASLTGATVQNLTYTGTISNGFGALTNFGFIGSVTSGTSGSKIVNVSLEDVKISSTKNVTNLGGLVGSISASTLSTMNTIDNINMENVTIYSTGTITNSGGIAGNASFTKFNNILLDGVEITAIGGISNTTGGIIGTSNYNGLVNIYGDVAWTGIQTVSAKTGAWIGAETGSVNDKSNLINVNVWGNFTHGVGTTTSSSYYATTDCSLTLDSTAFMNNLYNSTYSWYQDSSTGELKLAAPGSRIFSVYDENGVCVDEHILQGHITSTDFKATIGPYIESEGNFLEQDGNYYVKSGAFEQMGVKVIDGTYTSTQGTYNNSSALTIQEEHTLNENTTWGDLGVSGLLELVCVGKPKAPILLSSTKTISETAAELSNYGIVLRVEDGKATFDYDNTASDQYHIEYNGNTGHYEAMEALNIIVGSKHATIIQTTTYANTTEEVANSAPTTKTLSENTTWKDLGLAEYFNLTIKNIKTGATSNIAISNTRAIATTATGLALDTTYGINLSVQDGKAVVDYTGDWVIDNSNTSLLNALGLATNHYSASTETVYTMSNSNELDDEITHTLNGNTTFEELGFENGDTSVWKFINKTTGEITEIDVAELIMNGDLPDINEFSDVISEYMNFSFNPSNGKVTIESRENYALFSIEGWGSAELGLPASEEEWLTINNTSVTSNTSSNTIKEEKTFTLDENTTWADLGFNSEFVEAYIAELDGEPDVQLEIENNWTMSQTAGYLENFGINLTINNGYATLDYDNSKYEGVNIISGNGTSISMLSLLNIEEEANHTSITTSTTWYNTTSDSLTANVTKTMNENTTFGELDFVGTHEFEIVSNGVTSTVTVEESTTLSDFITALQGFTCTLDNGKLTISGSDNTYIKNFNEPLFDALNISYTDTYTEDIKTGWNDDSNQLMVDTTVSLTADTTFAQLGLDCDDCEIEIMDKNGNTYTVTAHQSTTVSTLVSEINSITGENTAEIRDGKFYINESANAYIIGMDSDIANALKISTTVSDYQDSYTTTAPSSMTSGVLNVTTDASSTQATTSSKLGEIVDSEGNHPSDYILDLGVAGTFTFDADTTIQNVIDKLQNDAGITASLGADGKITFNTNGSMTISGGLGEFFAGTNPTVNTTTTPIDVEYTGSPLTTQATLPFEIDESTKLSDIEIDGEKLTTGNIKVVLDGVTHNIATTDDTKIQDLLDALNAHSGVEAELVNVTGGKAININYTGEITLSDGTSSNIVSKLFSSGFSQGIDSITGKLTEVKEEKTYVDVDKTTALSSIYPTGTSVAEEVMVTIGEGSLAVSRTITVSESETMDTLMQKFEDIGVVATLWDGKLTLNSLDKKITIDSASKLAQNLMLNYSDNLDIVSSSEKFEKVTEIQIDASGSVAKHADLGTTISMLGITSGTFSIYRNGEKATVTIDSDLTFEDLKNKINNAFSEHDVDLRFQDGYLEIYSTSGVKITSSTNVDSSNITEKLGLSSNAGIVRSSRELYMVDGNTKLTTTGIFQQSDVTEGTFTIGNAEFTIDSNTTLNDLIKQINSSADANATAFWIADEGKFVIKSRISGASLINIEAGTSNFTDILGYTSSEWDADGNLIKTKLYTENQEVGGNAEFSIDGTSYTSTSNIVGSDITKIKGLTLDLKGVSNGETVTVTVEKNYSAAADAMQEVVDAYNSLIENVDKELAAEGGLQGESTLKLLRNQIRSLMMGSIGGTSIYNSLNSIGISTEAASGTNISTANINKLEFNKEKFIEAFRNDTQAVEHLLVGNGVQQGILTKVENVVENSVKAVTGYFASAEKSYTTQIDRLDSKIEKANAAVATYRSRLEQKFQYMDMMISKMQEQFSTFLGT